MGLFDMIFGRQPRHKQAADTFRTLTAYSPAFTNWRGAIYESELCRAAIGAKARHASKLAVDFQGSAKAGMKSRMKLEPNPWSTWSQFFYRVSTILDAQNTVFIVPIFNDFGDKVGVYPVLPSKCELVSFNGTPFLRFQMITGDKASIELSECGIVTRYQYKDDFFGENNAAMNPTMEVINAQTQGITEGVASSATYRFMARMSNFSDDDDLIAERKKFNENNFRPGSGGGLLLLPNTFSDVKQIESKPFTIDAAQMDLIRTNVQNYFGVSTKIMQNSANDEEMDAFFNGEIEPFGIQLSEVLTRMLFTARERATGNKIMITANRLQYMSVQHKISMAKDLGDRGMILIDEVRELFNYAPLPDGKGQKAPIRGEYYFSDDDNTNEEDENGN